jgi:hypothetical protein
MNAWLNHVRQFRKQNRHLSYKQLLSQARKTYGGDGLDSVLQAAKTGTPGAPAPVPGLTSGGGVTGFESRSSLTRSASTVGGRRSRSRKTRRRRR